jgi:hypothetical protein
MHISTGPHMHTSPTRCSSSISSMRHITSTGYLGRHGFGLDLLLGIMNMIGLQTVLLQ